MVDVRSPGPREGGEGIRRLSPSGPGLLEGIDLVPICKPMLHESAYVPLVPTVRSAPEAERPYAFLGPVTDIGRARFDSLEPR